MDDGTRDLRHAGRRRRGLPDGPAELPGGEEDPPQWDDLVEEARALIAAVREGRERRSTESVLAHVILAAEAQRASGVDHTPVMIPRCLWCATPKLSHRENCPLAEMPCEWFGWEPPR